MKNEKIPMIIALACGGLGVVLFVVNLTTAGGVLGIVAIVAGFVYAEARWHNIKQAEIDSLKEDLRQCLIDTQGERPGTGGAEEKKQG